MSVKVEIKKSVSWDVTIAKTNVVGGAAIVASSTTNPKEVELQAQDADGEATITVSADEFSEWSAKVLGQLRSQGWSPKR